MCFVFVDIKSKSWARAESLVGSDGNCAQLPRWSPYESFEKSSSTVYENGSLIRPCLGLHSLVPIAISSDALSLVLHKWETFHENSIFHPEQKTFSFSRFHNFPLDEEIVCNWQIEGREEAGKVSVRMLKN